MLTLYGVFRSRASRPLWLLNETGTPFRHVPVIQAYRLADAGARDAPLNTASPEFLKVNPMGQIPVMVDGDLVLTESLAITLHIARVYGGALGPRTAAETAMMEQWALLAATSVETPALEITLAVSNGSAAMPEGQAIMRLAAERLRRPLVRLEALLADRSHLVGDRFTVADINMAECLRYAQAHAPVLEGFPAIRGWLARCQERPAFSAMWEKRLAEPA